MYVTDCYCIYICIYTHIYTFIFICISKSSIPCCCFYPPANRIEWCCWAQGEPRRMGACCKLRKLRRSAFESRQPAMISSRWGKWLGTWPSLKGLAHFQSHQKIQLHKNGSASTLQRLRRDRKLVRRVPCRATWQNLHVYVCEREMKCFFPFHINFNQTSDCTDLDLLGPEKKKEL